MFLLFAMRRHGGFGELRPRYDEYVRDALRRGDRYAGTTFRWSANVVWLAADDVERAHAELDAASWSESERLHLQHWFHARAVTELALYEGADDRLDAAEAELRRFLGGVMDHVQIVRVETSIELRHPITETIGGAVFVDAGQVSRRAFDLPIDDLDVGVGFGVSYKTPVGPLRVDLGFPLERPRGDAGWQIHLSLGQSF